MNPNYYKSLVYEARVAFGATALLPGLILPLYALLLFWQNRQILEPLSVIDATRDLELLLPLVAALASAHVMTVEREAGFDELRAGYPEHPLRLPLLRTAGALALAAVFAGLAVGCIWLALGAFAPQIVLPALAPTLALLGAALLLGNLSGNYWVAAAVALAWWFGETQTRGAYTGLLALFAHRWPPEELSYDVNRRLLAGLGVGLLVANGYVSARRRRSGKR
jgi:hypothetical protein